MENKRPLMNEIVERLGNDVNVNILEGMVSDVLDGVKEYQESALGEFMAGAVAILYGELAIHKSGMGPSDILALAYEEIDFEGEVGA